MRERGTWIVAGAVIALSVAVAVVMLELAKLDHAIEELFEEEPEMQTLSTPVTRDNGTTVTIVTPRLEGETLADWFGRHDAAVQYAKDNP